MRQLSWLMSQFAAMRVLGGLPVKTPMLFSSRRQESSSVVTHDSSSFPCFSCPLLGNPFRPYLVRKIRRRSEQMETMISSIFWGVARKSLASCSKEESIALTKIEVAFWGWSYGIEVGTDPQFGYCLEYRWRFVGRQTTGKWCQYTN